ncbi:hypothetical protein [uncultured Gilvimarinus sp.]|uniref:hypothetical protein n=1 Tax=uncultured Gilvimarinus sp. TaxID=1689143 RepID=UPI0030ED7BE9|tara:strand:+ start:1002 stop:1748 length:747 start_codon:yes stop_codon:yes gene_type:complete
MSDLPKLPQYKCHKVVKAAKIWNIFEADHVLNLVWGDGLVGCHQPVTPEWMEKHKPEEGGYFVIYEDGYTSYSPAEAFEAGHSRYAGEDVSAVDRAANALRHGETVTEEMVELAYEEIMEEPLAEIKIRRLLNDHKVNPANDQLDVMVLDDPGHGEACHKYAVGHHNILPVEINFQNGPISEDGNGVNGLTHEVLLAIVADRLRGFQSGEYACKANACALTHIEEAMHWLQQRTLERMRRGVEGTHKV